MTSFANAYLSTGKKLYYNVLPLVQNLLEVLSFS
jgi:hypothetical protein